MRVVAAIAFLALAACRTGAPIAGAQWHPGEIQREFERSVHPTADETMCESRDDNYGVSEISIERTLCFGTCPSYTLRLFSDGRVDYLGQAYAPRVGVRHGRLDPFNFHRLARIVRDIGYFDLSDRYTCDVTDNPTVYTAVTRAGKRKVIEHYAPRSTGPAQLQLFEDAIDAVLPYVEWTK